MQLNRAFNYIQGSGTQPIPTNVTRWFKLSPFIWTVKIKGGTIWTTKGNVNNLSDVRKALSTCLSIRAN